MSEVVRRYYDEGVIQEWERLEGPYRRFELVSTLRLIEEFFPKEGRIRSSFRSWGTPSPSSISRQERSRSQKRSSKSSD